MIERMPRTSSLTAIVAFCSALVVWPWNVAAADPLTLKEAISRALAYGPAADVAIAQSDLGAARVVEARAPLYPSIAANGEYQQTPGYNSTVTNGGLTLAQLALDYIAFDGGRRASLLHAADYAAQAARLGVDVARAQIVFDTTVAYFDLMRARADVQELRRSIDRLSQYLAIVQNLQRSGRAIANDVLKIRSTRDSTVLALATANEAAAHAAIMMGALIGAQTDNLQLAEVHGLPPAPGGDVALSPVYRSAQRQLGAAMAGVAAARAERWPTVKLALTSGYLGINPPKTFGHHLGASYDGAVSVPIFTGGLVHAHIDEAEASRRTALAQLRQTEIGLKRDFADAISRYDGARRQLDILANSQTTADDAFALFWTRFLGGGNVTVLEVIDAYQQAQNLRIARLDNEFTGRQAAAQAALILGTEQ
jgi:multidrug efflux system outer membrane protein